MLAKIQTLSLFLFLILSAMLHASDNNTTQHNIDQNLTFESTYWKLIDLNEHILSSEKMSRDAHIVFSKTDEGKGTFKGASGCNEMLGKYELNGNHMSIDAQHIAMTRMACPYMGIETKFVEILGRVRMWKINADYLTLMDEQEVPLALFRAVFIEKR
jgi:putative lipoprotein